MKLVYLCLIVLLVIYHKSYSQLPDSSQFIYKTRNVIGLTPVKRNVTINGVAIGFMGRPWKGAESLKVNGLNLDTSPFALFGGVLAFVGTFLSPFNMLGKNDAPRDELGFSDVFPDSVSGVPEVAIEGASLSAGLLRNCELRGVSLNAFVSFTDQTNGMEVTGIMNLHYSFKGIIIAALRNKTTTGKGVQIALINSCKSGHVIQFGLLNRIGNRVLPIVNFSLKKRRPGIDNVPNNL